MVTVWSGYPPRVAAMGDGRRTAIPARRRTRTAGANEVAALIALSITKCVSVRCCRTSHQRDNLVGQAEPVFRRPLSGVSDRLAHITADLVRESLPRDEVQTHTGSLENAAPTMYRRTRPCRDNRSSRSSSAAATGSTGSRKPRGTTRAVPPTPPSP